MMRSPSDQTPADALERAARDGLGAPFTDPTPTTEAWAAGYRAGQAQARAEGLDVARDLYSIAVGEHGHDETHSADWPSCLPAHIAMNRYRAILAGEKP